MVRPELRTRNYYLMYLTRVAFLAIVYIILARLSLYYGTVAGQVSPIWLPSGVTIAILLLGGVRFWPGIALGAAAMQLSLGQSWLGAICIAAGELGEAAVAWYLLRQRFAFTPALTRVQDVIAFVVSTVLVSVPLNATIGTATLGWLSSDQKFDFVKVWINWWTANSAGCLITGPALLVWLTKGNILAPGGRAEATTLGLIVVVLMWIIFGYDDGADLGQLKYAVFPPLLWASLRFGRHGAVSCVFVTACGALWATVKGHGPFVEETEIVDLLLLQGFLITLALTGLVGGAATHERAVAVRELASAHAFMNAVLENANVGIIACDSSGNVTLVNQWIRRLFGLREEALVGNDLGKSTGRWHVSPDENCEVQTPWERALHGQEVQGEEMIVRDFTTGIKRNLLTNAQAIRNEAGEVLGSVTIAHDVTEQKKAEAQLRHCAHHDSLTGLPNRAAFLDAVDRALAYSKRQPDYEFAVLFVDLDGFKAINDVYGHYVGDSLLVHVAEVLTSSVRAGDMVARLGGDEFTVLLDHLCPSKASTEILTVVERIQCCLAQPIQLKDAKITAGASIGLAAVRRHYTNGIEILADADHAMYNAKRAGKGRYSVYVE